MAVLPNSREQMIAWFAERIADWGANADKIGITAQQVADIAALLSSADNSLNGAIAARTASKDATVLYYADADALRDVGADLIKVIKAYAESTNDPSVYATASIPPPAAPSPAGPPVKPTELDADLLLPFGISLKWKGSVSQGAYFGIWRRVEGEANFSLIDTTKAKAFEDRTLSGTVNSVEYYIAAYRDEYQVNSAALSINIGGGSMSSSISMAA